MEAKFLAPWADSRHKYEPIVKECFYEVLGKNNEYCYFKLMVNPECFDEDIRERMKEGIGSKTWEVFSSFDEMLDALPKEQRILILNPAQG